MLYVGGKINWHVQGGSKLAFGVSELLLGSWCCPHLCLSVDVLCDPGRSLLWSSSGSGDTGPKGFEEVTGDQWGPSMISGAPLGTLRSPSLDCREARLDS